MEKTRRFEELNKKLEAYGSLIIFLNAAKKRGEHWNLEKYPYSTVRPEGTTKFQDVFEKNYHLFSTELIQEYLAIIGKDKHFRLVEKPKEKEYTTSHHFSMNLTKKHEIANREFQKLKKEYDDEVKSS